MPSCRNAVLVSPVPIPPAPIRAMFKFLEGVRGFDRLIIEIDFLVSENTVPALTATVAPAREIFLINSLLLLDMLVRIKDKSAKVNQTKTQVLNVVKNQEDQLA